MIYPIMRFTDFYGRPGVVFKVINKINNPNGKIYNGTFALFKRYNNNSNTWSYGTYRGSFTSVYNEEYEKIQIIQKSSIWCFQYMWWCY